MWLIGGGLNVEVRCSGLIWFRVRPVVGVGLDRAYFCKQQFSYTLALHHFLDLVSMLHCDSGGFEGAGSLLLLRTGVG